MAVAGAAVEVEGQSNKSRVASSEKERPIPIPRSLKYCRFDLATSCYKERQAATALLRR